MTLPRSGIAAAAGRPSAGTYQTVSLSHAQSRGVGRSQSHAPSPGDRRDHATATKGTNRNRPFFSLLLLQSHAERGEPGKAGVSLRTRLVFAADPSRVAKRLERPENGRISDLPFVGLGTGRNSRDLDVADD